MLENRKKHSWGERLGAEASPRLAAIGALTNSLKFRGEADRGEEGARGCG